jgi:hypothetical protein
LFVVIALNEKQDIALIPAYAALLPGGEGAHSLSLWERVRVRAVTVCLVFR